MTTATRIKKLSDALGRSLDESKKLRAQVAELEAIAVSLAEAQADGTGLAALAAIDAWKVYKERNKRK